MRIQQQIISFHARTDERVDSGHEFATSDDVGRGLSLELIEDGLDLRLVRLLGKVGQRARVQNDVLQRIVERIEFRVGRLIRHGLHVLREKTLEDRRVHLLALVESAHEIVAQHEVQAVRDARRFVYQGTNS